VGDAVGAGVGSLSGAKFVGTFVEACEKATITNRGKKGIFKCMT